MRLLALLTIVVAGCNVEVGEGHIAPVTFDGYLTLPSDKARTDLTDLSFRTDSGDEVVLRVGPPVELSVTREIEFFSADEASLFRKKLDGHTIVHIDLDVKSLVLLDASTETPVPDTIQAEVLVEGVSLGETGALGRVWVGDDTTKKVISAIQTEQALELGVEAQITCASDQLATIPTNLHATVTVQPILTVKIF